MTMSSFSPIAVYVLFVVSQVCEAWYPENPNGNSPNPKATYLMNLSTAAWFIGNDSGLDNITELTTEARYGAIGIGWQVNNKGSNFSNEDQSCQQTAESLKQINPSMQTLAPRNTECVGVIYNVIRNAIDTNQYNLFLTDPNNNTKIYIIPWGGAGYTFDAAWINFLSNDSIDWFVTNWIEPAVQNDYFDGIYWDGCSPKPNTILSPQQYQQWQAGSQLFYQKAVEVIKKYNKWSMCWHGYYFNATNVSTNSDPVLCTNQILNYIQINIANNTEFDFSFMYNYKDKGSYNASLWLALFLIVRGKSATLMMKVEGGYEIALSYPFDDAWTVDYGIPLKDAYQIENNIFFRPWSRANVTFNCNDMTYKILPIL